MCICDCGTVWCCYILIFSKLFSESEIDSLHLIPSFLDLLARSLVLNTFHSPFFHHSFVSFFVLFGKSVMLLYCDKSYKHHAKRIPQFWRAHTLKHTHTHTTCIYFVGHMWYTYSLQYYIFVSVYSMISKGRLTILFDQSFSIST